MVKGPYGTLPPLAISSLALLNEAPMHPYEMYHLLLTRHEDRLLKVSVGSLYRVVQRLEQEGYASVVGTEAKGNRPERTTYEITEAGRDALVVSVRTLLRNPAGQQDPWVLAFAEAHNVPREDVIADLRTQLSVLRGELEEIDSVIADAERREIPEKWFATAYYLRHMAQAKHDFLTTFTNRVESNDIPWQQ